MYTLPELAPPLKDVAVLLLVRGSSQMRDSLAFWLVSRRRRGKLPHAVLPRPTSPRGLPGQRPGCPVQYWWLPRFPGHRQLVLTLGPQESCWLSSPLSYLRLLMVGSTA